MSSRLYSACWAHETGVPTESSNLVKRVCSGEFLLSGFGDAEIDHLGMRSVAVSSSDQNVHRLKVVVNDALLVRVLDGVANLDE